MQRYYIYGSMTIMGTISKDIHFDSNSIGILGKEFPTKKYLEDKVREVYPDANKIIILSICELSKEDYDRFLKEE